jgi:hypothetical protein
MLARAFQDYFADVGRRVIYPYRHVGTTVRWAPRQACGDNGAVIGTAGRDEWGKVRT